MRPLPVLLALACAGILTNDLSAADVPIGKAYSHGGLTGRNWHGQGIYSGTRQQPTRAYPSRSYATRSYPARAYPTVAPTPIYSRYGSYGYGNAPVGVPFGGFGVGGVAYGGPAVVSPIVAPPIVVNPLNAGYGFGYSTTYSGFGRRGFRTYSEYAVPVLPVPLAPPPLLETPVEYGVAESATDAEKLKALYRGEDVSAAPFSRDLSGQPIDLAPSTPEQQARSLELERHGDTRMADANYLMAYSKYASAVDAAPDRPEARAKLVVALAAIGKYDRAVDALKELLSVDPDYPSHFLSLESLFQGHAAEKLRFMTRVAEWTARHPGDPDKLLLLGSVMHFDGDIDRSRQLLRSAAEFGPYAGLVRGFLNAGAVEPLSGPSSSEPALAPPVPTLVDPLEPVPPALPAE